MKGNEFDGVLAIFIVKMKGTLASKGADYSIGADRLSNFKEVAKLTGLSPRQVWGVYFAKHVFAIMKWVRDGQVESEPIAERLMDAANYCVLAQALQIDWEAEARLMAEAKARTLVPTGKTLGGAQLANDFQDTEMA